MRLLDFSQDWLHSLKSVHKRGQGPRLTKLRSFFIIIQIHHITYFGLN